MSIKAPTVKGIPSADFWNVRDRVWPFLENFASRDPDGMLAEEMAGEIMDRKTQLWVIGDFQAVAITRVTRLAVRIERAAGVRRHEWQELFDAEIRAWARALGKKRVIGTVRPGWAPFGKKQGYVEKHRVMVLEL